MSYSQPSDNLISKPEGEHGDDNSDQLQKRPESIEESLRLIDDLKFFLATAPANWQENQIIRRYYLNNQEGFISCVYWRNIYYVTGTDIVRGISYKFKHFGRAILDQKKFEEGIFSDLRGLKCGTDSVLEEPRSEFLNFLHKNQCLRTQKKQKVFYWFSVPHDQLFTDALERDLKRELEKKPNITTKAIHEPALSFNYNPEKPLHDQVTTHLGAKTKELYAENPTLKQLHEADQVNDGVDEYISSNQNAAALAAAEAAEAALVLPDDEGKSLDNTTSPLVIQPDPVSVPTTSGSPLFFSESNQQDDKDILKEGYSIEQPSQTYDKNDNDNDEEAEEEDSFPLSYFQVADTLADQQFLNLSDPAFYFQSAADTHQPLFIEQSENWYKSPTSNTSMGNQFYKPLPSAGSSSVLIPPYFQQTADERHQQLAVPDIIVDQMAQMQAAAAQIMQDPYNLYYAQILQQQQQQQQQQQNLAASLSGASSNPFHYYFHDQQPPSAALIAPSLAGPSATQNSFLSQSQSQPLVAQVPAPPLSATLQALSHPQIGVFSNHPYPLRTATIVTPTSTISPSSVSYSNKKNQFHHHHHHHHAHKRKLSENNAAAAANFNPKAFKAAQLLKKAKGNRQATDQQQQQLTFVRPIKTPTSASAINAARKLAVATSPSTKKKHNKKKNNIKPEFDLAQSNSNTANSITDMNEFFISD